MSKDFEHGNCANFDPYKEQGLRPGDLLECTRALSPMFQVGGVHEVLGGDSRLGLSRPGRGPLRGFSLSEFKLITTEEAWE